MSGAYDPRAVANLMLDEADKRGWTITNLALQKLLYFAHGIHLTKTKRPLVSGYFEAWQYGPVHPAVYRAFKPSGSAPIINRAVAKDPLTGKTRDLPKPTDLEVIDLVSRTPCRSVAREGLAVVGGGGQSANRCCFWDADTG
jgi:uncharacterized phage-associated protein